MTVFKSPYDQYAHMNGKNCEVGSKIDPTTYDYEECGDMYNVTFEDGTTIVAWPEEIGL